MTDTVLTAEILLLAPTPTPTKPPATSAPAANGQIPPLNPDMNAPGMAGLLHTSDYLAAYVLWACVIAILIGALMVALGPRLGRSTPRNRSAWAESSAVSAWQPSSPCPRRRSTPPSRSSTAAEQWNAAHPGRC